MLKKHLITGFSVVLLTGMAGACVQSPPPEPETTVSMEGRSAYSEVSLPPDDQRFGAYPEQIALDAFGITEPVEGNFAQEVQVVEQTPTQAVVTLSQTGLPDDSVEGMRYWLEFEAGENQWELVWAGRQVKCWPGRGSQEWSTDLCS